jgi:mono/diheme cytochrome c family protein
VYSDRENRHFGLYNEHCVTCHGVAGGGDGPASLLQNPYPRDFRAGVFKWKSTERAAKPTREDLLASLHRGVRGSAMPSFDGVDPADLQALVDYVIYLSVRGEFERRLLADAVDELGYEETRPEDDGSLLEALEGRGEAYSLELARERLAGIAGSWVDASNRVIDVPDETPADVDSVARGRELFHGQIANCAGCHGMEGRGGMPMFDFDDWTKEYTTRLSITPSDSEAVRPFRQAGALRPRQIDPRQLDQGVFRGGGDSETLYRLMIAGIAGTPMPGREVAQSPSLTALTSDQIWDLVHYVQALAGNVDEP